MEGMEDAPIKEKKPRTPAQVEAFKRAQDIRNDNAKIKKEHAEAIKTEKVLQLIDKQKKTKEIQEKISAYHSEEEESEEEEPKPKTKSKPKTKPKKKKIVYETESSEEEEIVYVKRSKSKKPKARPKKKIVYESESEEEEEKPQQSNLQQNVAKSSNDQLKYDLYTERIHSALRSLGYIA
jgi:hypothetical protein